MECIKKRFMFDTNALNRICESPEDEMSIYRSKSKGFEYYFTEVQCQESSNTIKKSSADVDPFLVERDRAEHALNLLRIIPKLQTQYVGKIATLLPGGWLLDGTFEILPDTEEDTGTMFEAIINVNLTKYYNDGMIAMTAIKNGCTVVTNDGRLFKIINRHFPERAIHYEEFIFLIDPRHPNDYSTI